MTTKSKEKLNKFSRIKGRCKKRQVDLKERWS